MDIFQSPLYRLNKRLLCYLGQWPLQTPNERNFYRTTTVLLIGSVLVPEFIKFIMCMGDLNGMIECLPVFSIHCRSVVKFINSCVKATQMRKLTDRIKNDWNAKTDEFEKTILRTYAERGRLLTIIYTAYMYSSMTMFLSLPLIPIILDFVSPLNQSRDKIYLVQAEYFIDQEKKYFYILIHAYIAFPIAISIFAAYDTMYTVYVQHACGMFATLGARLQSIGCIANNNKSEMYKDHHPMNRTDKAYDDIVVCIKMHNEAIEIAKLIESSSCISLLFVIGASTFTTTVTGFKTVTNLDQPGETLRFGIVVIGELIHLFYICWQGQVLMEHSEDVFRNAYNVDWYDVSSRGKKLLILIMMRSLEPCKLTAGKIFVLSMETYAAMLKTSMSYFMVLLSVQ